jgi:hypothetical protein
VRRQKRQLTRRPPLPARRLGPRREQSCRLPPPARLPSAGQPSPIEDLSFLIEDLSFLIEDLSFLIEDLSFLIEDL